jgi:thymidylate synthase (FAD)
MNNFDYLKTNIRRIQEQLERDRHLFDGSVEVIAPSVTIDNEDVINWDKVLPCLERIMRTCYKSEGLICPGSDKRLVSKLVHDTKHTSTIEHAAVVSFRMVIDRGISHEVVRHRIAGHSQESTRYVDYVKKGGGQIVYPVHLIDRPELEKRFWYANLAEGFRAYHRAREVFKWTPQEARTFLPTGLKTELVTTFNFRSLRNFFQLRAAKSAHPDMRIIAESALALTKEKIEVIFDDIDVPDLKGSNDS